jgi:hypothetical protein
MGGVDPIAPEHCAVLLGFSLEEPTLATERRVAGTHEHEREN